MGKNKIPVDLIVDRMAEKAESFQEKARKASDILLGRLDTQIASTPYEIVYEEDRVRLKHYRPKKEPRFKHPLLVVYALINRETMLDLQPGRSVVQTFLENGIDLYMIDWGYPTRKDRYLTIDDHVNGYMDNVVEFLCQRHGVPKVHLMGICMGGTFSVIYSALHPEKVRSLVTTVSPTNFDTSQGLLHVWMRDIDADRLVETFGNLPGDFLNFGFLMLNPARLMIDKYVGFMEQMDNKGFVENFIRMEKWIFDSPDVPGETFRQFIKDCYQKNLLIQNRMEIGGRRVDLERIQMPVLNFYGRYDHLVPPEACERLVAKVGTRDARNVCLDTGHIGIYVSSKCQKEFAPQIVRWLQKRDDSGKEKKSRQRAKARRVKETESTPSGRDGKGENFYRTGT